VTGDRNGDDGVAGYGKPPAATRFKKGRSGNPKGRPKGRHKQAPYEAVLGQTVTIREEGIERKVTAAEAFLLQLAKRGLEGDLSAARKTMTAIEAGKSEQSDEASRLIEVIINRFTPGTLNHALELLRMGKTLDQYRETARMALEPWLIEAALERLGDNHLSREEQRTVLKATRTPWKVNWPDWWEEMP
tara:strand:- start:157 stop:723 length:567 start_codon:yes stop_codon:yes gene_type:complete